MPRTAQPHRRNGAAHMLGTIAALTQTAIVINTSDRRFTGPLESFKGAAPRVGTVVAFAVDHTAARPRIVWAEAEEMR